MPRIVDHEPQITRRPLHHASHATRTTSFLSRLNSFVTHLTLDTFISLLIFLTALYGYTSTLAPTVIEGDAALYQFTPYVLGVTYPTGFPLYILLGKLWLTLFPFGEIAWRMNLLSALCSAAALPLLYNAARRFLALSNTNRADTARWAALAAVGIFATLPTFWRWSTEAKTYGLSILLFSGVLYTLARALEASRQETRSGWFGRYPLMLPSLLLGLQISVHNNGVLLLPGLLALVWLNFRRRLTGFKSMATHLLLLAGPSLLYLYIPLRAEWLIAEYGRQTAIERGLLADFYHSGLNGLIRYFTAADFTGGVTTNWGLVPGQFFTVYIPLLIEDMTIVGVVLGVIGAAALALTRPRLLWPMFLWYAVPIPFVLAYGQGEQSAFLLPSFLIFSIFAGNAVVVTTQIISLFTTRYAPRTTYHVLRFTPVVLLLLLIPLLLLPQIQHNLNWLSRKWNRAIYNEWVDALNHPLEPDAGMLAHWGDLTSFWYLQHAEGRRPDLHGVYPPTEVVVTNWYKRGNDDLYIAGPLQGWAEGIQHRYQLIPWGRLVRIAPRYIEPQSLLPDTTHPAEATFGHQLRLLGVDFAPQTVDGRDFPITLTWQALDELPPRTTVSLRLTRNDGIVVQLDDRLRSGWFPSETLPAGQHVLSYALVPVPLGILPGEYRLQLVTYTSVRRPWLLPNGSPVLDLGPVNISPAAAADKPTLPPLKSTPVHDFNGEIELAGYDYTVARVGQGKGFGLELLWRAKTSPAGDYTLLAEVVGPNGEVLRRVERQPVDGLAPTSGWQPGRFIRDQLNLVAPASAPPGEDALHVRLSWLRPDGSPLTLRRWYIPAGNSLALGELDVVEKENRIFTAPEMAYAAEVNLENKAKLLGYNTALAEATGSPADFQIDLSACSILETGCSLGIDFYWQGLSEIAQPYKIFFHLVNAEGNIVTQQDKAPGERQKEPTTGWLSGEVVLDPIELALPPETAPGVYSLRLGMYLPPDGPRLFVLDDSGQVVSDYIDVGTVEVVDSSQK